MQDFTLSVRFTCTPIKIHTAVAIMQKWTDVPHQEPAQPGLGAWGPASQSSAGSAVAWTAPGCEASPSWSPVSTRVHRCMSTWQLSASQSMSTWWTVNATVHEYPMYRQCHSAREPDVLLASQCTSTWCIVSVTLREYLMDCQCHNAWVPDIIYCHCHKVWPSDVLSVPQYMSTWWVQCACTDDTSASQCASAWCSHKGR